MQVFINLNIFAMYAQVYMCVYETEYSPKSFCYDVLIFNFTIFPRIPQIMKMYYFYSESEVSQSCPTLCDLVDYSLPGSSIHGILQARILEWVAIAFSRDLPDPNITDLLLSGAI